MGARSKKGGVAPITVAAKEDGNVMLHKVAGEVTAWVLDKETLDKAREAGVELRLNHFADCPNREKFRGR